MRPYNKLKALNIKQVIFQISNHSIKPSALNCSTTSTTKMPMSIATDGPIPSPVAPANPDKT